MINIHTHTFLEKDIPRDFLPLGLVRVLNTKVGYFMLSRILKNLNPFSNQDQFERYITFVKIGKSNTQADILQMCAEQYPEGTTFVIHPMDMAYMEAGPVPRPYKEQLLELTRLMYGQVVTCPKSSIIPFIHIDPRRPNYYDLFTWAMSEGFGGVKLYPPLGIFPYDERLDCIYEYCQANKIPVLAHCSPGNPVYYRGSRKKLIALLQSGVRTGRDSVRTGRDLSYDNLTNRDLCAYFTHPANYQYVFEKFPDLKICLAHFGRENEWDKIIRRMMQQYPNLYCDISYSLYDQEHWGYLKVLLSTDSIFRQRCMFGSDWYMNAVECNEKQFSINLRAYLGEDLWHQIAVINPHKYLNSCNY